MHPHSKGRCCSRATPSSSQAAHQADRTPGGNTSEPIQGTQAASRQRVEHQRPHHQEAQRRSAEKRRAPKRSAEKRRVAVAASHVRRQAAPACSPPRLVVVGLALPCAGGASLHPSGGAADLAARWQGPEIAPRGRRKYFQGRHMRIRNRLRRYHPGPHGRVAHGWGQFVPEMNQDCSHIGQICG